MVNPPYTHQLNANPGDADKLTSSVVLYPRVLFPLMVLVAEKKYRKLEQKGLSAHATDGVILQFAPSS